ncbi:MAG: hypothetical protein C4313_04245 [Thermoflexus sp.]|mgnify:FL=1|uniref:hypothetical protein n=1 Tax=Thermoflexus sp. TaxID=1969742 RepID=UPI003331CA96
MKTTPWVLFWLGGIALAACRPAPLLVAAAVRPDRLTPNGDGRDDVVVIQYRLGRAARLSIYFVGPDGVPHYFRRDQPRPPGDYEVLFNGVAENRLLPDGRYTWVVEARDDGEVARITGTLTVSGSNPQPLTITGFSISPPEITPNRDGLSDRATINVCINRPAQLSVYLEGPDGVRYPVPRKTIQLRKPGEEGCHLFDYDAGVDRGQEPPPDGTYTVYAVAEDLLGLRDVATGTLRIREGGVPRAEILNGQVEFRSDRSQGTGDYIPVSLGGYLYFTLTVHNYGRVPIRTSGPPPGTCYDLDETFNAPRPGRPEGWPEESGAWRVGINFDTALRNYPFRWAVGRPEDLEVRVLDGRPYYYLPPGRTALVTGCIRMTYVPPRNPQYFWAGLIHEDVEIAPLNDRVDPHRVWIQGP